MNAEEGKKDDWPETGEKENYKFLYSKERWENLLFGLYNGCTISVAKFTLYFLSSQGFHETKRYRIPLVNTSSSLQHPSQCQPKAFLSVPFILFFFKPRTRSKICEILFDSSLEKTLHFTAPGYLLLSIAVLSAFYLGPKALKYFLICRLKAVFLGKEKASVLHTWKSLKMWK